MRSTRFTYCLVVALSIASVTRCDTLNADDKTGSKVPRMTHKALFEKFKGEWKGTCRTWFEPSKLADESEVSGTITPLLAWQISASHVQGNDTRKGPTWRRNDRV